MQTFLGSPDDHFSEVCRNRECCGLVWLRDLSVCVAADIFHVGNAAFASTSICGGGGAGSDSALSCITKRLWSDCHTASAGGVVVHGETAGAVWNVAGGWYLLHQPAWDILVSAENVANVPGEASGADSGRETSGGTGVWDVARSCPSVQLFCRGWTFNSFMEGHELDNALKIY